LRRLPVEISDDPSGTNAKQRKFLGRRSLREFPRSQLAGTGLGALRMASLTAEPLVLASAFGFVISKLVV